ncbi:MAG: hypothetical protein WAO52_13210 [Prolixibacteraceae bacterium]
MKNRIHCKSVIFLFILASGILFLSGCAVTNEVAVSPVTVPDIIRMSKDSMSSKDIIHEIRKSHTAYTLKANEYTKLQQEGVSDSVVNFMQKTHLNLVRQEQQMQDSYYWYPGYSNWWFGYPAYGWPYYYWGWNLRPSIIFRGGTYYRGGGTHRGSGDRR